VVFRPEGARARFGDKPPSQRLSTVLRRRAVRNSIARQRAASSVSWIVEMSSGWGFVEGQEDWKLKIASARATTTLAPVR